MNPLFVFGIIASYFSLLIIFSYFTSRKSDPATFFTANRKSPWFLVAFGMAGASLSGVTFISVPGEVYNSNWAYFQVVLGYLLGYLVIGTILLPLYYRLNLVSIYTYLEGRFGFWSYKTGAVCFLLSRIIGASFRLFLVAGVLQVTFFNAFGIPFWVSVMSTVLLIWLYTFRGGIKTIVFTDVLQTSFMLVSAAISIIFIANELDFSFQNTIKHIGDSDYAKIFIWDWQDGRNFFKQFLSGAFIAIVMTGLDQDMMQKNLTCKNLSDAQKNMFWFCIILVIINILFLSLGTLLIMYADKLDISLPDMTDNIFPLLAINHFSLAGGIFFLLGITAAAYSSADSALTALTTSFYIDILGYKQQEWSTKKNDRIKIHLMFTGIIFLVILGFNAINNQSVINSIFIAAGYTYGPLLGIFSFGLFTNYSVKDRFVPLVCLLSPLLSFLINVYSEKLFFGYQFGFEVLILNGLITFIGLFIIRNSKP
ncbi:MAG TPA: sodium:solute symporter [Cyclobacteriaceae bacterium]